MTQYTTIALDPSIRSCGLAVFDSSDSLIFAARVLEPRVDSARDLADRCYRMARRCADELTDPVAKYGHPRVFVTEWPEQYAPGRSRGDRNGLTAMAGVASALASLLWTDDLEIRSQKPKEWVQGTSKDTSSFRKYLDSQRGRRIASKLNRSELDIFLAAKSHDAGDAIGIGLHTLGRLAPVRIISRK